MGEAVDEDATRDAITHDHRLAATVGRSFQRISQRLSNEPFRISENVSDRHSSQFIVIHDEWHLRHKDALMASPDVAAQRLR